MQPDERVILARDYFLKGFNCAQSVFAAFHADMGLSERAALLVASGMGGGVGGLREICGAFTGLVMAMGALRGYDDPTDTQRKKAHYAAMQALGARFTADFDTLICRDLLQRQGIVPSPVPAERTPDYYRDRPCARYVEACARYGQEMLNAETAAAQS
jgi:C_GCAxxG_C_C family probable redox protein